MVIFNSFLKIREVLFNRFLFCLYSKHGFTKCYLASALALLLQWRDLGKSGRTLCWGKDEEASPCNAQRDLPILERGNPGGETEEQREQQGMAVAAGREGRPGDREKGRQGQKQRVLGTQGGKDEGAEG